MGQVLLGFVLYFVGVFVGVVLYSNQPEMERIFGTTYTELSSMKRECELVIPRTQECVASIVFLPTAIEE